MAADQQQGGAWPCQYVQAVPSGLADGLLQQIRADADALAAADNFWMPLDSIQSSSPRTPVEAAIQQLYRSTVQQLLGDACQGAEYWVQVYKPGKGLRFHFDKDEQLLVAEGRMVHPLLSSILYLTGDAAAATDPRQGATVVLDQVYDAAAGCPVPEDPCRSALVYPQAGLYALFDGRLGHGVLDSTSVAQRVTLLINWWREAPQGVVPLPSEDITKLQLTHLAEAPTCSSQQPIQLQPHPTAGGAAPPGSCGGGPAPGVACGTATQQQTAVGDDTAQTALSALSLAEQPVNSNSSSTQSGCGLDQKQPAPADGNGSRQTSSSSSSSRSIATSTPCGWLQLQLSGQAACCCIDCCNPEGALLVDQLLQGRAALTGPDAVHMVCIEHPGALLYPLEPEDCLEAAEAIGCMANTAAAVVPCSFAGSSETGSEDSAAEDVG